MKTELSTSAVITSEQMLEHWQGHRNLTRRAIKAFPDDKLFTYSIGGVRTFGEMSKELIESAGRGIHGIAKGNWDMCACALSASSLPISGNDDLLTVKSRQVLTRISHRRIL